MPGAPSCSAPASPRPLELGPPRAPHLGRRGPREDAAEVIAEAVAELRSRGPGGDGRRHRRPLARGLGHRRLALVEPPAAGRRAPARAHGRAAGAARGGGQRRQRRGAGRAPRRRGRGLRERGAGGAGHGHRRRAGHRRPGVPRRRTAWRASSVTWWSTTTVPTARAPAPAAAASRRWPRAGPSAWPASARRASSPTRCWGASWPNPARCSAQAVTQLAHDGDEVARAVLADVGRRLGAGIDRDRQHAGPGRGGHRRRRRDRRATSCWTRAREVVAGPGAAARPRGRADRARAVRRGGGRAGGGARDGAVSARDRQARTSFR